MYLKPETQRTLQVSTVDDYLLNWLEAFLIDRKASGVAEDITLLPSKDQAICRLL
jgi:hypothetical protein